MQKLATVIPAALAQAIRQAPLTPEKVAFAWRTVVGVPVDRVTTVHLDGAGDLIVTVLDAHWASELKRARSSIAARLRPLLGPDTVRSVRVRERPAGTRG